MEATNPVDVALAASNKRRAIRALLKDIPALVSADQDLVDAVTSVIEAVAGTVQRVASQHGLQATVAADAATEQAIEDTDREVRAAVYGILGTALNALRVA